MAHNTASSLLISLVYTADSLHRTKGAWWLESWFHFSFASYYNPKNMNFGALRVINDDYIKGPSGFGKHPHRDAEIFTYIVEGQLSHEDSMGNKEALPRGCVQYLSAGTGITHSVCLCHFCYFRKGLMSARQHT